MHYSTRIGMGLFSHKRSDQIQVEKKGKSFQKER